MSTTQADDRPMTVAEVCEHLRISRMTYYKWLRLDPEQFRTYVFGGKRLMERADLERLKERRRAVSRLPQ